MPEKILFMCPHNAAKSVIALGYFRQLATRIGVDTVIDSAGTDPDDSVWPSVVELLQADDVDVTQEVPRMVTDKDLADSTRIISLGCDLTGLGDCSATIEHWDDVPMASEDLVASRDAILTRVKTLIDELSGRSKKKAPTG